MTAVQIADDIAERIRRGEYPPATKLPSGPELADLYDTSLSTAHRVFLILRERGVAVGRQGKGVYVNEAAGEGKPRDSAPGRDRHEPNVRRR